MRCLVIEDEADTARYICNGLKEAGHTATLVRDGANGLYLATNERWDIIILDRMLPGGVDGLSIIATIRGLGKTTPVLILSALASLDERVRGLRGVAVAGPRPSQGVAAQIKNADIEDVS